VQAPYTHLTLLTKNISKGKIMIATILTITALINPASAEFVTSVKDSYPVLSPDGKTLLFQSNRNGRNALYMVQKDGTNLRIFLDSMDNPSTPSWSPDGKRITYVATVGESTEIFVINADGTGPKQLTAAPGDDEHPHWAANGRIFWDSGRTTPDVRVSWDKQFQEVFSMARDGNEVTQHTKCKALCTFSSLSPDGKTLLFRKVIPSPGVNWDRTESKSNSEVFIADINGKNERNLSNSPAFDGWPSWSPDSQWIVFASNRNGIPSVGQIFVIKPDGTGLKQLTDNAWSHAQPSFSQDGKTIYVYKLTETEKMEFGFISTVEFIP
jgi:TolB protein